LPRQVYLLLNTPVLTGRTSVRRVFPSTAGRLAFQAVPSWMISGLSLHFHQGSRHRTALPKSTRVTSEATMIVPRYISVSDRLWCASDHRHDAGGSTIRARCPAMEINGRRNKPLAMLSGIATSNTVLPACAVRHPVCIRPSCTSWSRRLSRSASGRRLDCAPPWRVITPPPQGPSLKSGL
jgi:hypothetical protein